MSTENNINTPIVNEASELNWSSFDSLITENNCKVSVLAKELGIPTTDLKKAMVEHYGNRIVFKRGRKGGVYWATTNTEQGE